MKEDITFEKLDEISEKQSDNECAASLQKAKEELFEQFTRHKLQFPTIFTTLVSGSYVD